MSRGTTLANLLIDLKDELGHSTATGAGGDTDARFKRLLANTQEFLYDDYDWRFLHDIVPVTASASGRFVTFPTTSNASFTPETVNAVYRLQGGQTIPLYRGISIDHYGVHNSLADTPEEADPVRLFDFGDDAGTVKMEVWPIPATDATLYVDCKRALSALTSDSDTADLDDQLIVLFTAAKLAKHAKHADADDTLSKANARYDLLKKRDRPAGAPVSFSSYDPYDTGMARRAPIIRVSG